MGSVQRWVSDHRFSSSLAAVISVTAVLFGTARGLNPHWLAASPSALAHGMWWTPATALLVPDSVIELVLTVALCLTVLAYAEHLLGSARAVLLFLVTGMVGVLAGIGLQALAEAQGAVWARASGAVLDPAIGVVGVIMAASAGAPVLWRRRLRLLGFSLLLMFALYGGDVDSVYRLCGAVVGLAAGVLRARCGPARDDRRRPRRVSYREARALIAAVVAVTSVGPLIVLLTGRGVGPLSPVIAGLRGDDIDTVLVRCGVELSNRCAAGIGVGLAPLLMSLVPLVLAVVAALGLRRGRRAAWLLALAMNIVMAGLTIVSIGNDDLQHPAELTALDRAFPGFAFIALIVPVAVGLLLVLTRKRFDVRASRRDSIRFAALALGAASALVVLDLALTLTAGVEPARAALDALRRFLPAGFAHSHVGVSLPGIAHGVRAAIGPVYWAIFTVGILRMLRSTRVDEARQDERFRRLLRQCSGTLGFLGTWAGVRHWFSADGTRGVAYRLVSGFAITVGDPVGVDTARAAVEFAAFCDRQGWTPVLYSVTSRVRDELRAHGWAEMPVAEETVVPLERFSLEGKAWAKVRQPYRRADREGVHALWTRWRDLSPAMTSRIETLSEQWVAEKALPEMGFTLGGVEELRDAEVALMLAIGPDGAVQAITSWLPVYEDDEVVGWTLDFMRRADGAMPGVMEFLIAASALQMKADGASIMSLSGAPLASGSEPDAGSDAVIRLLDWLGRVLEPAYGFRSLLQFKSKFNPDHRTLYLMYQDAAQLPAIGAAIARAYLPHVTTREYIALAKTLRG